MKGFKVVVATENTPDPETFVQVRRYFFSDGFLVIEGLWDTYFVRREVIREIRIVEVDYSMKLNYTSSEWVEEVLKRKKARDDNAFLLAKEYITQSINGLSRTALISCEQPVDDFIDRLDDEFQQHGFRIRFNEFVSGKVRVYISVEGDET